MPAAEGYYIYLNYDPRVTPTYGPPGVLAIAVFGASRLILQKQDADVTTNWTENSIGNVNSVTATLPVSSTGGVNPDISMSQSGNLTDGWLSMVDWNTFNNKLDGPITGDPSTIALFNALGILSDSLNFGYIALNNGFFHGDPAQVTASGSFSRAAGYTNAGSAISSSNTGSIAEGSTDSGGTLQAQGPGCRAYGYVSNSASIVGQGNGSVAQGYADGVGSILHTNNNGAFAHGVASGGGELLANNAGAVVLGFADGVGSSIIATRPGSLTLGHVVTGAKISSVGTGSLVGGDGSDATSLIESTNAGNIVYGIVQLGGIIRSSAIGALSLGHAINAGSIIETTVVGGRAGGQAELGGLITVGGRGGVAQGYATGAGSEIRTNGRGAHALGAAESGSQILAPFRGSIAFGQATNGAIIISQGNASMAAGRVDGAGSKIETLQNGSWALGFALSTGLISSNAQGSFSLGYVELGGHIRTAGKGSIALGFSGAAGIEIVGGGIGSFAQGHAGTFGITASGDGSSATGMATTGAVISSGISSWARGDDMTVSANLASVFGIGHTVSSYGCVVIGRYASVPGTVGAWVSTEPAFVIGNGVSRGGGEATAFQIDKDGKFFTSAAHKNSAMRSSSGVIAVSARTDRFILCDTSGGAVTVNLPAGEVGLEYFILDQTGNAAVNNITITPNGLDTVEAGIDITAARGSRHIQFFGGNWYIAETASFTVGSVTNVTASAPITSSGGATPNIAIPVATAIANGYLSSVDWSTFNGKVSTVAGSAPVVSSGGVNPTISMAAATAVVDGYLTAANFTTFNNKVSSVTASAPLASSGGVNPNISLNAGQLNSVAYFDNTGVLSSELNFKFITANKGFIVGESGLVTAAGSYASAIGAAFATATISASGDGSYAGGVVSGAGSAINSSSGGSYAHGQTLSAGTIVASGRGSNACGRSLSGGLITAITDGASAFGDVSGSGILKASGIGAFASGHADASGLIEAGTGGQAFGYASGANSKIISSTGTGNFAQGEVEAGGVITAEGTGAQAHGRVIGAASVLKSNGNGSFAFGYIAAAGGLITSTGNGSLAHGQVLTTGSITSVLGNGANASGYITGNGLIDAYGHGSIASGYNTSVTGKTIQAAHGSIAIGTCSSNSISVDGEGSIGGGTTTIGGQDIIVAGFGSIAWGDGVKGMATFSQTFGFANDNNSYGCLLIGRYGNPGGTPGSWVTTDPVFVVGNGTALGARATGYRIDKDGRVTTTASKVNKFRSDAGATVTVLARTDEYVLSTASNSTINLPAGETGLTIRIKADNAGTVFPNGAETINGAASLTMIMGQSATLVFSGGNWNNFISVPTGGGGIGPVSSVTFDDFIFRDFGGHNGLFDINDTVATGGTATMNTPTPDGTFVGACQLATGTTNNATGIAGIRSGNSTNTYKVTNLNFQWRIRTAVLSGAPQYIIRVGLMSGIAAGLPTDGVFFQYTNTLNGGNFVGTNRQAATSTDVNSTVAATTAWTRLGIVINSAGTSVEYFVDGVSIGSSALNIPTALLSFAAVIEKQGANSATSRNLDIDFLTMNWGSAR